MSEIVRHVAVPALHEIDVRPLLDPDGEYLVVPYETALGSKMLINLNASDERQEAIFLTTIADVPAARLSRMAVHLCTLNTRFSFITFALEESAVRVDCCIELSHTSDPAALIVLAYERITHAIEETHGQIERLVRTGRAPRVLREAARIVDDIRSETPMSESWT